MQNSYFVEYLSMVASENILKGKQYVLSEKCWPPQKDLSTRLFIPFSKYQVMKILLNNLLQTNCNLIVRKVTTKEGELVLSKEYLDWDRVNKWG